MEDTATQLPSAPSSRPGDSSGATRRLRKREQDRLAQRAARERNKQRIAELEATVARLSSQSGSGEVIASLENKLAAVTRERDSLAKSLSSIQDIISPHRPASLFALSSPPDPDRGSTSDATANASDDCPVLADTAPVVDNIPQCSPSMAVSGASSTLDDLGRFNGLGLSTFTDPIQPRPQTPCDCICPPKDDGKEVASPSIWRTANAILGSPHAMSESSLLFEEQMSEDFAVRAVLEGWDSVAAPGSLSPMWTKLRRIDKLQFSSCRKVERLAIMFIMHSLLMFHSRPTEDQFAKIPPWYIQRPSQHLSYSYAIDFFVWPGIRDRFVLSQHRYCSNHFWRVFASSFRLLWPHDFRDCYKFNIETGQYTLSADFTRHVRDLRLWTMHNDFFHFFPELQYDIPVSETIVRSPSRSGQVMLRDRWRPRHRDAEYASECPPQPDEQTATDCWGGTAFGQSMTDLPFSMWADLGHDSAARR